MDDSTWVVEVQCENNKWEAFATDPLPMEITDEIKQIQANDYLPSPQRSPDYSFDYSINIPFSPSRDFHILEQPIGTIKMHLKVIKRGEP